jgi:mannose-6-phosphate isomerase-like protein (cupin superfamily)
MNEIYLVAAGRSTAKVNGVQVSLQEGDMLVVEPGEVHTFTDSSDDYVHFVVQAPCVRGDKTRRQRVSGRSPASPGSRTR